MPNKKPKPHKPKKKPKLKKKKKLAKHLQHGKPNPERPKRKPGNKLHRPIRKRARPPRSGSIPRACRRLIGEAALLDCWLKQNPEVANAIVWDSGGAQPDVRAWPAWNHGMKAELRQAWMDAREWHAQGMSHFPGTPLVDPPPNQDIALDGAPFFRTVLDGPAQAWPWYLAIVAHSLAAEIEGWVPWSLRGLSPEALAHLLSGTQILHRDMNDGGPNDAQHPGGYVLGGSDSMEKCTPSHPTFTYRFLVENDLVDDTPRGTIARVIGWCRANLSHFFGTLTAQNAEYHWQYRGAPPVRRILAGTPLLDPDAPGFLAPRHWTAGCSGTTAFLRSLLRAVNIPVVMRFRGDHTQPYFIGVGRYLSHGDDPYNAYAKADYPAGLLLVDEATFASWFPFDPGDPQNAADLATSAAHVGQRVVDLAVWHFGDAILFRYCQDKAAGLGHADGKVFEPFASHGYTVAELEATHLWERLAAEAQLQGRC
ncbi:MAG: hypothetical protein ABI585_00630 [Betaproteobacteria bacterium]